MKDNNESNPNASQSKDTNENIQNDSQKCNISTYDSQSKDTNENNLNDSQSKIPMKIYRMMVKILIYLLLMKNMKKI